MTPLIDAVRRLMVTGLTKEEALSLLSLVIDDYNYLCDELESNEISQEDFILFCRGNH